MTVASPYHDAPTAAEPPRELRQYRMAVAKVMLQAVGGDWTKWAIAMADIDRLHAIMTSDRAREAMAR